MGRCPLAAPFDSFYCKVQVSMVLSSRVAFEVASYLGDGFRVSTRFQHFAKGNLQD